MQPVDNRDILEVSEWRLTPSQRVTLQILRRALLSALKVIEELLQR
jgi:hypothetical protein